MQFNIRQVSVSLMEFFPLRKKGIKVDVSHIFNCFSIFLFGALFFHHAKAVKCESDF